MPKKSFQWFSWAVVMALLSSSGLVNGALAHGPMPKTIIETTDIPAPPEVTWKRIGNFLDLKWRPEVASVVGTNGNEVGSLRTITLKGGGQQIEKLKSRSDAGMSMSYELIEPGPFPVSNLRATLSVIANGNQGSKVEWKATFMRADRSPKPSRDQDDAAAIRSVTDTFKSGLEAIH